MEAIEVSRVIVKEVEALATRSMGYSWTVPLRLVFVETFTVLIIRFHGNVYRGATLSEKYRHNSVPQWPDKWREHFYSIDEDTFLALETSAQRVTAKKESIPHPGAGQGSFEYWTIGESEMVGH